MSTTNLINREMSDMQYKFLVSADSDLPQMQEKENGDQNLPPMEPSINDDQRGTSLSVAEKSFNGVEYTAAEKFCARAKSGEPPQTKTKSVLVVERQRPLHELLHLKQEPLLLRELLQIKEERTPSLTKKISEFLKKPLDLIQKKQRKPVLTGEALQKPLMQQLSSKFPEAHVLMQDTQREIFDAVRFVSPIAMSHKYIYSTTVAFEVHMPYLHYSNGLDCNGREDGVNQSAESNGSNKRKAAHVVGNSLATELLKSDELDWNNDSCHVFQLEQDPSQGRQELQNQHINVNIVSECENLLQRAGSLRERTFPVSAAKTFVFRTHSLKEGLMPSRFLCFGLEFVQHQTSDKGTTTKLEKVLCPSKACEKNHATPGVREDRPQKNKVYPSDNNEGSFLFIQQESSIGNNITREQNRDPNIDPDVPSNTDCCFSAVNRVNTLRDILSTSQEEEFLSVLHREGMSAPCDHNCHLDLKSLESTLTCNLASFASKWEIKPQVGHHSDQEEIEYQEALNPDLQKRTFFQGRTLCNEVEGSKSLSGCKLVEDNCQPSPVCVLDSPFIDEILSPETAERFSDSKNQLIDSHHFSRCQRILKIATAETSIGRSNDTSSSWEDYYVLEKAVEALLHGSIIEEADNPWSGDSRWLQDAQLSDCSPEKTYLQYHVSNPDLLKEAKYQENMFRAREVLEAKATSDEYAFSNGRRMLEELTDSQILLDCVTEALETLDLRQSCYMFGNSSTFGPHKGTPSRIKFLNDIHQIICSWRGKAAANINGIVENDFNSGFCKWMSMKSELLEIGSEIEHILFEILIDDAIFDILNLEVKT
ncbi:hypothetical protein O6H91_15G087700 [Diphasiastrum complanatum]|uniref:Uncharacterized protein n=1 Tax=Diphasiastrum complanatum TaxID=34168 RepID=A0ACC2BKF6_DIPCM|nr:hypothetical protein O6H91_15G087700 [Diphasiastrum complanatum]